MLKEILSIAIALVVGFLLIRFAIFVLGMFIQITFGLIFLLFVAVAAIPIYFVVKKALFK